MTFLMRDYLFTDDHFISLFFSYIILFFLMIFLMRGNLFTDDHL
jgi:hypothetical protein